jgi:two-component system, LuxR family, response regulator FixJ
MGTPFPSAAVDRAAATLPPLVAVVDDDRAVVSSLEFALGTEGYRVAAFFDAQAYLCREGGRVDCLIVDFRLPGMDGIELLQELSRRGPLPPHVLIASNPSRKCRDWAAAAAVPLVEKPFLDEALTERIKAAVAESIARSAAGPEKS